MDRTTHNFIIQLQTRLGQAEADLARATGKKECALERDILRLQEKFAVEKSRRLKAEAEMRATLLEIAEHPHARHEIINIVARQLTKPSDIGTGSLSPEVTAKVREALEWYASCKDEACSCGHGWDHTMAQEALAVLDHETGTPEV